MTAARYTLDLVAQLERDGRASIYVPSVPVRSRGQIATARSRLYGAFRLWCSKHSFPSPPRTRISYDANLGGYMVLTVGTPTEVPHIATVPPAPQVRLWVDGTVMVDIEGEAYWVNPRTGIVTDGHDNYIGTCTTEVAVALKPVVR